MMTRILHIESATQICSVSIAEEGKLLAVKESSIANSHSEMLSTFIEDLFKEVDFELSDLDAIAVSMGPGSYTGLRIGVSSAKGLCFSLDKPLISVSTLQSMAYGMSRLIQDKKAILCPMIDARRMEVYASLFDMNHKELRSIKAEVIDESSYQEYLNDSDVYFAGDGAEKCKPLLEKHNHAHFVDAFQITSKDMIYIALQKFKSEDFEDVAYFEPYYLKDFIAGAPRVKGLK